MKLKIPQNVFCGLWLKVTKTENLKRQMELSIFFIPLSMIPFGIKQDEEIAMVCC